MKLTGLKLRSSGATTASAVSPPSTARAQWKSRYCHRGRRLSHAHSLSRSSHRQKSRWLIPTHSYITSWRTGLPYRGRHLNLWYTLTAAGSSAVSVAGSASSSRGMRPKCVGQVLGGAAPSNDCPLFRPDISPVGANRPSVMRCGRSLLVVTGRCCCCHGCCHPRCVRA